jgi:signal transduction histidine kinase/DNA-binding LacI/PurR family transcriptional regulator/AraC-like DNA-binding protein
MHNTRPTIGFLTSSIGESVSQAIWSGVVGGAHELDANLICFAGEGLAARCGPPAASNAAFDLASRTSLDGLVTWASALGKDVARDEIIDFHRCYRLPVVSLTLPLPGIPVVLIDSYEGMREIIAHLVEFHGHHRLAFIRGPEGHYYAQERYRAYTDALQAYSIPLDAHLVTLPEEFFASTGVKGVRQLLDERQLRPGVDFDALVTASDLLALGALDELGRRGIRVPQVVPLVGFNDRVEGKFTTPPLTSVRLPFYEQGYRAVELLLALLEGKQVPDRVTLPAKLRVRQSCGCFPPTVTRAASGSLRTSLQCRQGETFEAALAARRKAITDYMTNAVEASTEGLSPGWAGNLLDAFAAEVSGVEPKGAFLRELDHLLRQMVSSGNQVGDWQDVISILRHHVLPCLDETAVGRLARAQDACEQGRVLIGDAAQRATGHQMMEGTNRVLALRQVSRSLISAFDFEALASVLAQGLPGLDIASCYLALYEDLQDPITLARLILAFDEQGRVDLETNRYVFPSDRLIPLALLERRQPDRTYRLMLEPLYFQEEQLGFALFEIGSPDGTVYETLRDQISSALKGALLFDEIRKARTAAEKADQLKTRLLANVSHELRAPLNVIISCARETLHEAAIAGAAFPETLLSDLRHIRLSAEHQLRVVNDLLDISRAEIGELDLYPELLDPRPLLQEVFHSMRTTHSDDDIVWRLELPDRLPTIRADTVRLRQILLNLLSNASKFVEEGEVFMGVEVSPPHLHIWVQDTGPGIPDDMQERIFEPFVTVGHMPRYREGAGLGLSITRRLVLLHWGTMKLESQAGKGSTFHIYLPLPTLSEQPAVSSPESQPALLLISSCEQPASEIVEFCRTRGLRIQKLRGTDDLDGVMQRARPVALAWDLVGASPGDWVLVRRLRNHPQLSHMPFILYGQNPGAEAHLNVGMTNFVVKPTDKDALIEIIDDFCPSENTGPLLIVDDDPEILTFYREMITQAYPGYPLRTAANGADAVDAMVEEIPSLVILDLMMPEMDGFDVLDWMRANDRFRQVPVLILSNRILGLDDVKRIERHALVTVQSKGILSEDEILAALHRTLFGTEQLPPHTSALVKQAVAYVHQHYARPFSRWELAGALGVSEDYLSRIFRQEMGLSPWQYLNRYRILQAKELLLHTSEDMRIVARQVGFTDPAYFSRVFHRITGSSPTAYRENPE